MKIFKLLVISALFLVTISASAFGQKLKPEEILAKHLDSIGKAETRAAAKSMIVVGDATVKFITQKNQSAEGRVVLASAGNKNFWGMNLNAVDYPAEKFSFDGNKVKVAFVRAGSRSILGNFVASNGMLMSEGLLGGTLSTSWALHDTAGRKAKISSGGTKKIDGKEVYVLDYSSKNADGVDVSMYFDKETFHHVRTEYKRTSSAGIGVSPDQSSRFSETRLKVTEDFSDFKPENGLTLPHNYRLLYTISGQNGTTEIEWAFKLTEFGINQNLDDKTFDAEAN